MSLAESCSSNSSTPVNVLITLNTMWYKWSPNKQFGPFSLYEGAVSVKAILRLVPLLVLTLALEYQRYMPYLLPAAHTQFHSTFNSDLKTGYLIILPIGPILTSATAVRKKNTWRRRCWKLAGPALMTRSANVTKLGCFLGLISVGIDANFRTSYPCALYKECLK